MFSGSSRAEVPLRMAASLLSVISSRCIILDLDPVTRTVFKAPANRTEPKCSIRLRSQSNVWLADGDDIEACKRTPSFVCG